MRPPSENERAAGGSPVPLALPPMTPPIRLVDLTLAILTRYSGLPAPLFSVSSAEPAVVVDMPRRTRSAKTRKELARLPAA